MVKCRRCKSTDVIKNGKTSVKKPKFKCKDCDYQFVENPENKVVNETKQAVVRGLLLERIGQRAICRSAQVSRTWLKKFIDQEYASMPSDMNIDEAALNIADPEAENMEDIIKKN